MYVERFIMITLSLDYKHQSVVWSAMQCDAVFVLPHRVYSIFKRVCVLSCLLYISECLSFAFLV